MAPPRDSTKTLPSLSRPLATAAAAVLLSTLAACPQERPGAETEIPPQRVPPAVVVDPQPSAPGTPASADGGVTRRP